MTDAQSRLVKCFKAVFPELADPEIARASLHSVSGWDSIRTITLLAVIEEEFQISVPPEDLENLVSFELILDYLQSDHHVS